MTQSMNVPNKLKPVIDRWNDQGKEYYLGPENMFTYNQHTIVYNGGQDIPLDGWFARNGNATEDYLLTKSDVEDIQNELLKYFKTIRWTLLPDWHCNYQCPMCQYHGDGVVGKENYFEDMGKLKRVLTKEEAYRIIDKLDEYGIKILSTTSLGETLLYPHWREISQYAHDKGMELWMITNGSLWTEDIVEEVAALGYTNIRVSLDALSFETYAKIRSNKKEYYESAMQLPELLMKHGIIVNVHFVKQKENLHEVNAFLEYWKEKKVNSISIANQFSFENEVTVNTFAKSEKDYIKGLCTAFGNMQTFAAGNTKCCCGTVSQTDKDEDKLETVGCKSLIDKAIQEMRTENSDLRKLCLKCALYVPYSDETIIDGWKVSKNPERETWTRIL